MTPYESHRRDRLADQARVRLLVDGVLWAVLTLLVLAAAWLAPSSPPTSGGVSTNAPERGHP